MAVSALLTMVWPVGKLHASEANTYDVDKVADKSR